MAKKFLGNFDLHDNSTDDVLEDILGALEDEGFFEEEEGQEDEIEEK